jgi:hypothetical protein
MPRLVLVLAILAAAPAAADPIAVTDDGRAAVGGGEVWRTLDGKHEPIAIDVPAPRALAITHDGAGLAVAAIDNADDLAVIRIAADGTVSSRADVIDGDHTFAAVVAIDGGFVAIRDDRALVRVEATGARTAELVAAAGERVAAVLARRGRALALIQTAGEVRGQWLDLAGDGLAWGARSARLAIDPARAALSPDHRHLAAASKDDRSIVIVALASGAVTATPMAPDDGATDEAPLGFVDADTLAIHLGRFAGVLWHDGAMADHDRFGGADVAVGDRGAIEQDGGSLRLMKPGKQAVLGYDLVAPTSMAATSGGGALIAANQTLFQVDATLRLTRRVDLPVPSAVAAWNRIIPLDAHHVLASGRTADGYSAGTYLIDRRHPDAPEEVATTSSYGELAWEPSTGIAMIGSVEHGVLTRWDARHHKFGTPVGFALDDINASVRLLDPVRAGGRIAEIEGYKTHGNGYAIAIDVRALRDDHIELGREHDVPVKFADEFEEDYDYARFEPKPGVRRPSGDGALIATLEDQRITLRERDGAVRWTVTAPGATDLAWATDGAILVLSAGAGIARVDAATGATTARATAWGFGLRDTPKPE